MASEATGNATNAATAVRVTEEEAAPVARGAAGGATTDAVTLAVAVADQ